MADSFAGTLADGVLAAFVLALGGVGLASGAEATARAALAFGITGVDAERAGALAACAIRGAGAGADAGGGTGGGVDADEAAGAGAETGSDAGCDTAALATGTGAEATALAELAGAMVIGIVGGVVARPNPALPASSAPWGITATLRSAENCW